MPYDLKKWKDRYAERTDLSTRLTHLSRPADIDGASCSVVDIVFKMLKEKRILASTTDSGFIIGATPAVCFQDAPPSSLCQNVYFEQKYRNAVQNAKLRYCACGLMFPKPYAYRKGARPVIYEATNSAKKLLSPEQWWRVVNFDLADDSRVIDWSHEREWRHPGDFAFDREQATVLVTNENAYRNFLTLSEGDEERIHHQVAGIVVLEPILR